MLLEDILKYSVMLRWSSHLRIRFLCLKYTHQLVVLRFEVIFFLLGFLQSDFKQLKSLRSDLAFLARDSLEILINLHRGKNLLRNLWNLVIRRIFICGGVVVFYSGNGRRHWQRRILLG